MKKQLFFLLILVPDFTLPSTALPSKEAAEKIRQSLQEKKRVAALLLAGAVKTSSMSDYQSPSGKNREKTPDRWWIK